MALTAAEEALVRQLLDEQAALLSLAGSEATIISKLGAAKVTLSDLVAASSFSDTDLLLVRQATTDKSGTPQLLATYLSTELATVFANLNGSSAQQFAVALATAAGQAPQSGQLYGRNVVVNGCCSVSQINGTTEVTPTNNSYPIDNVQYILSQASKLKCDKTATLMGVLGAVWSLRTTVLAKYTPIATDVFNLQFPIEGMNFARFQYGTANAKAGSLQFKALPSVAGTYSGCIANYAGTRSYPFSFTVTADDIAAGGKLVKIENIPGDTGGVWVGATNAGAAEIRFDLGCGANFKGAAGAWTAGDIRGVTGALALVDQVNGSTLAITDVQFEVGAFCTQFERKLYDQVNIECQKYLPIIASISGSYAGNGQCQSATSGYMNFALPVAPRIPCTGISVSNATHFSALNAAGAGVAFTACAFNICTPKLIGITFTVAAGLAAGDATTMLPNNASSMMYGTGAQI